MHRGAFAARSWERLFDREQLMRIGDGTRAQEHRVQHGEHGGRPADPDRKRRGGDQREDWRAEEDADGVAEVLDHGSLVARGVSQS